VTGSGSPRRNVEKSKPDGPIVEVFRRQLANLTERPPVFDRDVLALDEARFRQALAERSHPVRHVSERSAAKENNDRHRWLLRPRRERPSDRRAAEQRDELASFH
jgi:hypothetical protein